MSDIIALSFDGLSSPSINLKLEELTQESHAYGWGFGWYPHDHQAAVVAKDPLASGTQVFADAVTDWQSFRSTVFLCKARGAAQGYTHHETQPFSRSFAGRDWLFMHNGDLDKKQLEAFRPHTPRLLVALRRTDSERAFSILLGHLQDSDARQLSDVAPETLLEWFQQFDALGGADMVLSDGMTVACFHGSNSPHRMYHSRIIPPGNQHLIDLEPAAIQLNDPRDTYRAALIFSSATHEEGKWERMQPGQLMLARRSAIVWNSLGPVEEPASAGQSALPFPEPQPVQSFGVTQAEQAQSYTSVTSPRTMTHTATGDPLGYVMYDITHKTIYEYSEPVAHSTHVFRLQPLDDYIQEVMQSTLSISSVGEEIHYEDVFGNRSTHYTINGSYSHLMIQSMSRVKIYARPPDDPHLSRRRASIPLVWMPWQRQIMMAYLMPEELPETQLIELTDYAMSFVERNDYHLLATLEDINRTIYHEYQYIPGSTSLATTPFEVYSTRQGVCQDFAQLFICLCRLLGIPARYQMGYIFTGSDYANKIQSEASHAWVEVYLPYVGWRGFDPTNGYKVNQNHIRVACGRNYRDATPTTGTIYKGGGTETLRVEVKIEEASS